MAVLLITYECNAETSKADKAFYEVLRSYQWVMLYGSSYAITAEKPAIDVWGKAQGSY
jgi:hypothetical protein